MSRKGKELDGFLVNGIGQGYQFSFTAFSPQSCLQRIHQGLVFYEKLLGSDIFTGEPSLLPDGPVSQLHASLLGLRQLLQV